MASATFEVAVQSAAAAAGNAYCMLQNTDAAGGRAMQLVECGFTTNAATLSSVGLIRAATLGTVSGTPSPGQTVVAYDVTTSKGNVATTWSAAGTLAATPYYFRQFVAAAVQGSGVIWSNPDGWEIPPGGALFLWNYGAGAGSALSAYFRWRE